MEKDTKQFIKLESFAKLHYLLSIETGEKTEYVFLWNKGDIIEEDRKYYKQDLTHIEGDLYKSADGKIFKKEIKYKYSTRTAISELDFNIIFDREFQKRVDEPQKRDEPKFAEILLKELNEYKYIFNDQREYDFLRKATDYFIEYLENKIKHQQTETNKPEEVYKNQNLFKVGLLFAKGEMNKYFTVNSNNETVMNSEFSAPMVEREIMENLGIEINNKYILASINNYATDKNIFNSFDMMTKVISHCQTENTFVDPYFKSRLPIK